MIFSWNWEESEQYIKDSTFYYDFGTSIVNINRQYLDFLQIGILFSIWKESEIVDLTSTYPISIEIITHWKIYWDFDGLNYNPPKQSIFTKIKNRLSTFNNNSSSKIKPQNIGLLFGGGKDSMMGAGVLDEIISKPRELILLSFLHPNSSGADFAEKLRQRRQELVLKPVKKLLKAKVKIIETDLLGRAMSQKVRYSPHIAIYSAAMPIISHIYSVSEVFFNYEMPHYWVYENESDIPTPYFRRSRPEYLEYTSKFISKLLNHQFYIGNMSYSTNIHLHFKILVERYPQLWDITLTCERKLSLQDRYCHNCHKCFFTMLFGLLSKNTPKGLDPDKILSGEFGKKLMDDLIKNKTTDEENTIYPSHILGIFHRMDFYHWMYNLNTNDHHISQESASNFTVLKDSFGNEKSNQVTKHYKQPQKYLPEWFREEFIEILSKYSEVSDNPHSFYFNNKLVKFDFDYNSLPDRID